MIVAAYGAVGALFLALVVLEGIRPLRRWVEPRPTRIARNLGIAGLGLAALSLLQAPVLVPVAEWARTGRIGLLNRVSLSPAVETAFAVLLLDYTLWHWHRLTHRVPFLWRFHLVHHVDLDLDSSTALRFHFGEMILSATLNVFLHELGHGLIDVFELPVPTAEEQAADSLAAMMMIMDSKEATKMAMTGACDNAAMVRGRLPFVTPN